VVSLICEKYLQALNSGNLNNVLELFSEGAVVVSPLYGEMLATEFYKNLFQDTVNSETKFLGVYQATDSSPSIIMHFNYKWTLRSNTVVNFECVDLFELTEEKDKFKKLRIIYDTYPLRKDFEENKNA
jgi:hypothetical protein